MALEDDEPQPRKTRAQLMKALSPGGLQRTPEAAPGSCRINSCDSKKTPERTSSNSRKEVNKKATKEQAATRTNETKEVKKQPTKAQDERDLVARARFETACQLLHKRILEKEHRLTVCELSFLNRLLTDESDHDDEFDASDRPDISDRLSAIETSLANLRDDPLFKTPPSSPDKMLQTPQRLAMDLRVRSQSSDGDNSRIEVMSSDSSQFSIEGALQLATESRDLEDNLFLSHSGNSGTDPQRSFEQTLYTRFSHDEDEDELQEEELHSPPRTVQKPELELRYLLLGNIPRNRILSAKLMEALRGFLPSEIADQNYWLKFESNRDENSMPSLLTKIRGSTCTIIAIKATTDGTIFGSFTSTPWRLQNGWFGGVGEAFLFRSLEGNMEVYPYTSNDSSVQYCSAQILAVGGGSFAEPEDSPYQDESTGIGLLIDGDVRGGESNCCATFCNPRLFGKQNGGSAVGNEFFIDTMEVWTLTPCQTVQDAETRELEKLFLEK